MTTLRQAELQGTYRAVKIAAYDIQRQAQADTGTDITVASHQTIRVRGCHSTSVHTSMFFYGSECGAECGAGYSEGSSGWARR